jgi:hypothetical protein
MSKKPDMGWIRGALRGQIQEKLEEAKQAEESGDSRAAADARRIASQWNTVYENSRNASEPSREDGR